MMFYDPLYILDSIPELYALDRVELRFDFCHISWERRSEHFRLNSKSVRHVYSLYRNRKDTEISRHGIEIVTSDDLSH